MKTNIILILVLSAIIICPISVSALTCSDLCKAVPPDRWGGTTTKSFSIGECDSKSAIDLSSNTAQTGNACLTGGKCAYNLNKISVKEGEMPDCPYPHKCYCYDTTPCSPNCFSRCNSGGCGDQKGVEVSFGDDPGGKCNSYCTAPERGFSTGKCFDESIKGDNTGYSGVCYYGLLAFYCSDVGCECKVNGANKNCYCYKTQPCPDGSDYTQQGTNHCDAVTGCTVSGTPGTITTTTTTTTTTTMGTGTGTGDSGVVIDLIKTAVYKIVMTLYCLVLYIASAVAALFIIITGIKYMSSDEEGGRAESRKRMVYAIVGLMVVVLACPLVNLLFAGTNIGIPNASGGKDACPPCPIIAQLSSTGGKLGGGTVTTGSTSGAKCSDSDACAANFFCANMFYFNAKNKDSKQTESLCESSLGKDAECDTGWEDAGSNKKVCKTGYSCKKDSSSSTGYNCKVNAAASQCTTTKYCEDTYTTKYCDKSGNCQNKVGDAKGGGDCGGMEISGLDNKVCSSEWCIGGGCSEVDICTSSDDCDIHYTQKNKYCKNGKCVDKIAEKLRCDNSMEISKDNNRACRYGNCVKDPARGADVTSLYCLKS